MLRVAISERFWIELREELGDRSESFEALDLPEVVEEMAERFEYLDWSPVARVLVQRAPLSFVGSYAVHAYRNSTRYGEDAEADVTIFGFEARRERA